MATGGTGGHIFPAIATAKVLGERGHEVSLIGQVGGMEEKAAQNANLPFVGVEAGKLARNGQGRPDPRQLMAAFRGLLQARRSLAELRPAALTSFGGFAAFPGLIAAQSLGIPTVLHEQNAHLGLTQRVALGRSKVLATVYPHVVGAPEGKMRVVGMPIREDTMTPTEARARLAESGLYLSANPSTITLLVMGGSQGSLALNEAAVAELPKLDGFLAGRPLQVLHATGPRWIGDVKKATDHLPWYHAGGFVDATAAFTLATLALTRAGTGTLAEAAFHGVPLLMVPLPESAENHQWHNAQVVAKMGAGMLFEQPQLKNGLIEGLRTLAAHDRLSIMQDAAKDRATLGAAVALADIIEEVGAAGR